MRRAMSLWALAALAVAGIAAGVFVPGGSANPVRSSATTTRITVNASEFKFTLSKSSVPVGATVIFTIVNKGKISHDFKIAGQKTPTLAPGTSAKITITIKKAGRYAYLCTLPGHAGAGMKGSFAVGVAPAATTTLAAPPRKAVLPTTTVNVVMADFDFTFSKAAIPHGTVIFKVVNKGATTHDFFIYRVNKNTPLLAPGKSATLTVTFTTPGVYHYLCTVGEHALHGMQGDLKIT